MAEGGAGPSGSQSGSTATKDDDALLAELLQGPGFAIYPLPWCPHLETGISETLPTSYKDPCGECGDPKENWICLKCGSIYCSRYVNGHQVEHHGSSHHALALSYSDLSVWCFDCDSYVDNELLYNVKNQAHKEKFGEEMLKPDYSGSKDVGLTFEMRTQ